MCKLPNRFPPSLGFFTPLEYVLQAVKPNKLHLRNCCVNCYLIWRFLRKFQKAWFEKTNGRHHDSQKKLNKTDCLRTSPILLMRSSMPLFIVQHTTSLCTFFRSSPSTVQHRASLCMFHFTYLIVQRPWPSQSLHFATSFPRMDLHERAIGQFL